MLLKGYITPIFTVGLLLGFSFEVLLTATIAIAIITEWDQFKNLPWNKYINFVKQPANIFDGRNILNKGVFEKLGYNLYSIGK